MKNSLVQKLQQDKLLLCFEGELTLYTIPNYENQIQQLKRDAFSSVVIDLQKLVYLDTAGALFLYNIEKKFQPNGICTIESSNEKHLSTIDLVKEKFPNTQSIPPVEKKSLTQEVGAYTYEHYVGFLSFIAFLGKLFATKLRYLLSFREIRFKEIAFEIYESAIKALGIIALTSFLIGLVVAYQSAYQLKIYGANIFIVDMLGISILRELAPLITAIVIAGRSGSSYTAQIGAMKITQEIDAMKTMGFEPYAFLVLPRIIALMITMPILIFVADIMAMIGGMIVANIDLHITPALFIDRFNEVVAAKHFIIGVVKGPFFAFLIATIGIYRGLMVKDDTQSIGFNTTKSVVESIFAVIVCDAVFSIAFTNLGI